MRHASLRMAFMYMHIKFQEFGLNINQDIFVQKIYGINLIFKFTVRQYGHQSIYPYICYIFE